MNAIECNNLTKQFGDFKAVNNISLTVEKGEIFGFLGANGAGKTTAIRIFCGLSYPTSGEAQVAGFDVYREQEQIKKHIGYMSQKFSLYDNLTVAENITFYGGVYGLSRQQIKPRRQQLIETLGLEEEANKLVGSLPLGWKQKLAFSVAILHRPEIVFLDEPTVGVDVSSKHIIIDYLKELNEQGMSVLYTSHHMQEAQDFCHRVLILDRGTLLCENTPQGLIADLKAQNLEEVFVRLTSQDMAYE